MENKILGELVTLSELFAKLYAETGLCGVSYNGSIQLTQDCFAEFFGNGEVKRSTSRDFVYTHGAEYEGVRFFALSDKEDLADAAL